MVIGRSLGGWPTRNGSSATTMRRRSATRLGDALVGLGQHHDEFLAAIAREEVERPHVARDARRHLAQHFVAGGMAVRVVDALEPVDVEEEQRRPHRRPRPARAISPSRWTVR